MQTGKYGKSTLKSKYQIFAYAKNLDKDNTDKVSGDLLYAKTDKSIIPDKESLLAGNKFIFTYLDMNKPFDEVTKQMDNRLYDGWENPILKYNNYKYNE